MNSSIRSAYRIFDHTADLGVEIYGSDEKDFFFNAAFALFDIMTDLGTVYIRETRDIFIRGSDLGDLLINFLRELLYMFSGEGLLLREFSISDADDRHIKGTVGGEFFVPDRHCINVEIKAVTYHGAEVEKTAAGWLGRVIFDV
jgi:SHS2 domain-containing protein